jgi:predicted DNA-binding transcriptional regulator AlpA
LPYGVLPRLLNREASAQYMGISASKFDELVRDGRAPRPKRLDGRVLWDRVRLDAAIDAIPEDGEVNPLDLRYGRPRRWPKSD